MNEIVKKLLNIKSIVTLVMTVVFAYLAVTNVISGPEFLTVFGIVIAFYFGTQVEKKNAIVTTTEEAPKK